MTLSMEPQGDETLHGVATTTVTTNECGGRGTVFEDPFVATRVGDVPSSVTVADPTTGHIPMSANPTPPGPGLVLEGTYRLDLDFQSQTINGSPVTKALPNRSEWWAFRSACDATGCVAAGVRLVDDNPNQSTGIATALDFRDGRWQETTSTLQPAEQCPNGPDADVSTVSWSLVPQPDGALRGVGPARSSPTSAASKATCTRHQSLASEREMSRPPWSSPTRRCFSRPTSKAPDAGCVLVARILHGLTSVLFRWCPRQDSNLRPANQLTCGMTCGEQQSHWG